MPPTEAPAPWPAAESPWRVGLLMLVVVLVVQQVESNLLQPVLVGRAVRLHCRIGGWC